MLMLMNSQENITRNQGYQKTKKRKEREKKKKKKKITFSLNLQMDKFTKIWLKYYNKIT